MVCENDCHNKSMFGEKTPGLCLLNTDFFYFKVQGSSSGFFTDSFLPKRNFPNTELLIITAIKDLSSVLSIEER